MSNPFRRLFWPPRTLIGKYVSKELVVADLGCGPGYYALPMAEIVGPEGKVYAVDSHTRSIEALRTKATKRGFTNIEARVSSASELGFIASGSVDFVFAHGLLCCMTDHAGAAKEIERILKPNGAAYLSISKLAPKKDPRRVSREEWRSLLGNFQVDDQGESFNTLWASCHATPPPQAAEGMNIAK